MLLSATCYGQFVDNNPLPRDVDFNELLSWLEPLVEAEQAMKNGDRIRDSTNPLI